MQCFIERQRKNMEQEIKEQNINYLTKQTNGKRQTLLIVFEKPNKIIDKLRP